MGNTRIVGDFSFTTSTKGLTVAALDYHAQPQLLIFEVLRQLGLVQVSERETVTAHELGLRPEHSRPSGDGAGSVVSKLRLELPPQPASGCCASRIVSTSNVVHR